MLLRATFVTFALMLVAPALADQPSTGPLIEGFGPSYPIDNRDVPLRDDFVYKAVFDIAQDPVEVAIKLSSSTDRRCRNSAVGNDDANYTAVGRLRIAALGSLK